MVNIYLIVQQREAPQEHGLILQNAKLKLVPEKLTGESHENMALIAEVERWGG